MARTGRLFELLQILRNNRYPVSAADLAQKLEISVRTVYRDIRTLQAQGADIEGEPGLGYVLQSGFMLPPLMFSHEEIEALVLGGRWVSKNGDERLSLAAQVALSKIAAVLPSELKNVLESSPLFAGGRATGLGEKDIAMIRDAMREERKLEIRYLDLKKHETTRTIWPIVLGYFNSTNLLAGWCELRGGFRHFRVDRLTEVRLLDERYPRRRQVLMREWEKTTKRPPENSY